MSKAADRSKADTLERRLVFISHANPEQNDFALWLGVQLANAGYEVWSDVTKLIGGEVFWDDIEDAIRHHTAKFVLVVSAAALAKEGVKDEINLAVMVERTSKIDKFVVPVRVDDVPFAEFKANIARKNAIDFTGVASSALATLFDRWTDGSPRASSALPMSNVGASNDLTTRRSQEMIPKLSSQTGFPSQRCQQRFRSSRLASRRRRYGVHGGNQAPWFGYFRLVGTYGTEFDLRQDLLELAIERQYKLPLSDLMNGSPPESPE